MAYETVTGYHVTPNKRSYTVKEFLREPRYIARAIEKKSESEMLSNTLLNTNYSAPDGTVGFDRTPSDYPYEDDESLSIAEGAAYPEVHQSDERYTKSVEKFGRKMYVTFEDERHNQAGPMTRGILRMKNLMIRGIDKMMLGVLHDDPDILTLTNADMGTGFTIEDWSATNAENILRQIFMAKKKVASESTANGGQSYRADTLLLGEDLAVMLMLNKDIREAIVDEENVVYTGVLGKLAGLTIMTSPYMYADQAWICAKGEVGGIADELPLTVKPPRRDEDRDRHILQVFRYTAAFVTDPGSMVRIPGLA